MNLEEAIAVLQREAASTETTGLPVERTLDAYRAAAAAVADLAMKARLDHLRLLRVEQMLAFLLRRQVVENKRRPAEGETVLPGVEFLIQQRTWLDEFNAEWQQTIERINAAQAAKPEEEKR